MSKLLIIFVKNPELGRVKTRLAKSLGEEAALAVYLKLLTHTRKLTERLDCDKAVHYSRYIDTEDGWNNKVYKKRLQQGDNLGGKMHYAIAAGLDDGYDQVCLIGTDIYELTEKVIENAFSKLESKDVVIGPAKDGGYYLIGMKKPHPEIFDLKQWSTSNVFSETIKRIEHSELTYGQTRLLTDIDEMDDLKDTDLI